MKKEELEKRIDSDYAIAYDFATKAYKKFQEIVKAIVLFGSVTKRTIKPQSDIDLVILVDDCVVQWDEELIGWYREELTKLLTAQEYAQKLHVNTVTLTTFWEELRVGDPVIINMIRYGQTLVDVGGFFDPLKVLLARGRIRPTPEAIVMNLKRAAEQVYRGDKGPLFAVDNFYWGMVDAAHAALMAKGVIPPSPENVGQLLIETFVKEKHLQKKYVDWYNEVYELAKKITYGEKKEVSGKEFDVLSKKANEFVKVLRNLTMVLTKSEKIIRVEKKEDL